MSEKSGAIKSDITRYEAGISMAMLCLEKALKIVVEVGDEKTFLAIGRELENIMNNAAKVFEESTTNTH